TGATLNGTVVNSSLTSVGTLANLTVTNPISGDVTGSAATLTTARAINGVDFDGSAAITVPVNSTDDAATAGSVYPLWTTAAGNNAASITTTALSFVPSTGVLTATGFTGALTGNASTATALETARNINGVAFDGTTDITVTAAAGTLTGTTLNAAVVNSSLTSVGTITTGVWDAGAVTSSGAVEGTSIVKTGGLATEFLKADGSVDANTYLTSAGAVTSLTGTANQVDVSSATGDITVSLPATITGLTSVTSTDFVGDLTGDVSGNATTSTTATNIAGGLAGSIPYQSGANATTLLAAGTPNYVLTMNAGGTAPEWSTTGAGDMLLGTAQTVTALKTHTAGFSASGAEINLNANSNFATNINTGTSTGTVTIGGNETQLIDIAAGTGVQTLNLGTGGTESKTINIGTGAVENYMTIGNTTDATQVDIYAGSGEVNIYGDLNLNATGTTLASPREIGINGWNDGNAARYTFGDTYNAIQNAYGDKLQFTAYHGIEIVGNRRKLTALAFADGNASNASLDVIGTITTAPVLVATAAASQTANLQEWRNSTGTALSVVDALGNVGIGQSSPSAVLHLKAGTSSAETAPLKFTSGALLTATEAGAVEYDGSNLTLSDDASTRYTLAKTLTETDNLDFPIVGAHGSSDHNITVTGASVGDAVSLGVPNASVVASTVYSAWVSAADIVTVRLHNYYTANSADPASGTFRVTVIKY
ncbi:MAG: hypothetical protein WD577_03875, partial [Bacteroidales bacterium]